MNSLFRARVRKFIAIFIFLTAVICIGAIFGASVSVGGDRENVEGVECFYDCEQVYAAEPVLGNITNVVIFICFSDEDITKAQATVDRDLINCYIGEDNSLKDYYSDISYGKIEIDTIFPREESKYFVYQAPYRRSHYGNIKKNTAASARKREESSLLNGAVNAADRYFDYQGVNLDVNSDGYADSVSFLVSGECDMNDSSAWGGLLWPHSANLADYSVDSGFAASKLNGVKVGQFSFNFMGSVDTGLLCHETGHVMGMPDLYHYERDKDYISVGEWDLMHSQNSVPQYPTAHIRDRYLNALGDNQIVDIKASGTFSLKPVTLADGDEAVACRLTINENESIWFEYRNNSVSTYDSGLYASGLIVYRVNASVSGNEKGGHNKVNYPDEVFIYRPSVSAESTLRKREEGNLKYAALSLANEHFRTLGGTGFGGNYDKNAIYLTNGKNTGVKVEIISEKKDEIVFKVDANGYGSTEVVDIRVEGDTVISYGETPNITLKIKYKGYDGYVTADPNDYIIEYDAQKIGAQTATAVFTDADGNEITCAFTLTVNDRVQIDGVEVETLPDKLSYNIGEPLNLNGLSVRVKYESGKNVTVKYDKTNVSSWKTEGFGDSSISGVYDVKITYIPLGASVFIEVNVLSALTAIRASQKDAATIVDINEELHLTVEGVQSDGTVRVLTSDEYTVTGVSREESKLYKEQTATVRSKENSLLTCTFTVYIVKMSELMEIVRLTTPASVYRYGRELDLTDGILQFKFENGSAIDVPMANYYSSYNASYYSTKLGTQELRLEIGGCYDVFKISVLAPDNGILVTQGDIYADIYGGYILMETTTVDEAEQKLGSYLNMRFVKKDGEKTHTVTSRTHSGMKLNSECSVELVNNDGKIIKSFRIYIIGDVNGDGEADERDVDGWAEALFKSSPENVLRLDTNGDGSYTLTDFVRLRERYCA